MVLESKNHTYGRHPVMSVSMLDGQVEDNVWTPLNMRVCRTEVATTFAILVAATGAAATLAGFFAYVPHGAAWMVGALGGIALVFDIGGRGAGRSPAEVRSEVLRIAIVLGLIILVSFLLPAGIGHAGLFMNNALSLASGFVFTASPKPLALARAVGGLANPRDR
jgi:hypothetical protein